MDHWDVKDYGGSTEKSRKHYRMKIVKNFLSFAKKDKARWEEQNDEETTVLRR
jgi:hypothetical protein